MSRSRGPQYRSETCLILLMGTPKGTPMFGRWPYLAHLRGSLVIRFPQGCPHSSTQPGCSCSIWTSESEPVPLKSCMTLLYYSTIMYDSSQSLRYVGLCMIVSVHRTSALRVPGGKSSNCARISFHSDFFSWRVHSAFFTGTSFGFASVTMNSRI